MISNFSLLEPLSRLRACRSDAPESPPELFCSKVLTEPRTVFADQLTEPSFNGCDLLGIYKFYNAQESDLVYRLTYNGLIVAFKMSRRSGSCPCALT
jgi:hypothetical protein